MGSRLEHAGLAKVIDHVIQVSGVKPLVEQASSLEITERITKDNQKLYFVLNMSNDQKQLPMKFRGYHDLLTDQVAAPTLKGWEVEILKA